MHLRSLLVAVTLALTVSVGVGSGAAAHDEISSSEPADRSQFDDPISEVTIEFGAPVDGVEIALVDPDDREIEGTIVKVSDTTARLEFEPLADEGQYIVRYLAEEDGHLVAGAISFVYGSEDGTGAGATTWVIFGVVAAVILAIGGWLSLRRARRTDEPVAA